ncbi:MAG: 30S ribosomal protein S20 [Acidobacteriota bacterium]|nr:30S ribosomal protein S20 [Acidobacteriota bacterium]
MAKHKSAVKAHRQSVKKQIHNRELRSRLRSGLKKIRTALDSGDTAGAKDALDAAFSLIDKMSAKGIIHDNAAGRYKSRLVKRATRAANAPAPAPKAARASKTTKATKASKAAKA